MPQRWVTDIEVDPANVNHSYLSYSGYRDGDNTPYVFETVDGGIKWSDITSDLPQGPINTLALDPTNTLIAGGDLGVFYSDNGGGNWNLLGTGLPRSPAMDLRVHAPSSTLFVATFGRGLWKVPLPGPDTDTDGVSDLKDNCLLDANPTQQDADDDGFGNHCDADINNDCTTDFLDLGLFKQVFFSADPVADLNVDGTVDFLDLGILKRQFFDPPGPAAPPNGCSI